MDLRAHEGRTGMMGNQKRDVKKYFFMLPNAVFELGLHVYELAIYAYLLRIEDRRTWQCVVSYPTPAFILLWLSSSAVPSKTARIRVESSGGAGTPPSPIWVHTTHHRPLHGGTLLSRLPTVAGRNTRQYSSAPVTIPHRSISPHRRRRNSVLR